ncbi:ABC transporter transmembrane domain-containing protein [Nonomuraea typhae]|uniref:ABC transporter transmembrane domain-containing protein n=1 Tax=Nonomuraea typhae TaxID=2603600 RepID=A0ABW7YND7_9ACTN
MTTTTPRIAGGPTRAARELLRWCLRTEWRAIAAAAALTTLWQLALVSLPLSIQRALDGLVAADRAALLRWSGVIVGTGLLAWLAQHAGQHLDYMTGAKIIARLRRRLSAHLLTLDTRTAAAFGRGDLQARNSHDVDLIWIWVGGTTALPHLVIGLVTVVVAVWFLHPLLALICLGAMAAVLGTNVVFGRILGVRSGALAAAQGQRADVVDELVGAALTVKGAGAEQAVLRAHHARSAEVTRRALAVTRVGAGWSAVSSFVPLLAVALGVAAAAPAVAAGTMTVGGLAAFTSWMLMLTAGSTTLSVRISQRAQAAEAAARIAEVLSSGTDVRSAGAAPAEGPRGVTEAAGPTGGRPRGVIEVAGLAAGHGGRTVLGPVGFSVEPGAFAVVTGPVASGKSTLLRVLVRLQEPSAGRARYRGMDVRALDPAALRELVTLVPQRPVLVSGTVADNLTLGLDDPPGPAELRAALRAAAVLDEVDALPGGLGALIGEGGATLSGGQRRRVALAGALLRRPDVLLLDDVTAAVDEATEERVLAGVRDWLAAGTVIAVSHRPAVLRLADQIIPIGRAHG